MTFREYITYSSTVNITSVGSAVGYIALVFGLDIIVSVAVTYFVGYKPGWEWANKRLHAGCTETNMSKFGVPTTMICPSGVLEKIKDNQSYR
jgi:hypothetical protein